MPNGVITRRLHTASHRRGEGTRINVIIADQPIVVIISRQHKPPSTKNSKKQSYMPL